jgi:hypothetical protein
MAQTLDEVIDAALALPRAEREVVVGRLRASLDEPDVPGGIVVRPQDLVEYGAAYAFPGSGRHRRDTVTLTATPGPTLSTRFGLIAIADPWFPEAAPTSGAFGLEAGECPTVLTTITRTRVDTGASEPMPVAATIGAVADVAVWHPLALDGRQFHLDSDSSLGAFYEITDAAALQPVFEDSLLMQGIFNRALEELIVPLEVDGRTLAAAFVCGKDLHPAWAGYDANGVGVAALLDFGVLALAQGRASE